MVTFKNRKSGATFKVKNAEADKFDRSGYYERVDEPKKTQQSDSG